MAGLEKRFSELAQLPRSGERIRTRGGSAEPPRVSFLRRIDGEVLPFETVRESIATWLTERSRRLGIRQYIAMLAGRAEITGVEMDATASPLVQ